MYVVIISLFGIVCIMMYISKAVFSALGVTKQWHREGYITYFNLHRVPKNRANGKVLSPFKSYMFRSWKTIHVILSYVHIGKHLYQTAIILIFLFQSI